MFFVFAVSISVFVVCLCMAYVGAVAGNVWLVLYSLLMANTAMFAMVGCMCDLADKLNTVITELERSKK